MILYVFGKTKSVYMTIHRPMKVLWLISVYSTYFLDMSLFFDNVSGSRQQFR